MSHEHGHMNTRIKTFGNKYKFAPGDTVIESNNQSGRMAFGTPYLHGTHVHWDMDSVYIKHSISDNDFIICGRSL